MWRVICRDQTVFHLWHHANRLANMNERQFVDKGKPLRSVRLSQLCTAAFNSSYVVIMLILTPNGVGANSVPARPGASAILPMLNASFEDDSPNACPD